MLPLVIHEILLAVMIGAMIGFTISVYEFDNVWIAAILLLVAFGASIIEHILF